MHMRGILDHYRAIGKKVSKIPEITSGGHKKYAAMRMSFTQWLDHSPREPKPFKSGLKVNTVKAIVVHPQLGIPAFLFEEDDSYVECRRCKLMEPLDPIPDDLAEDVLRAMGITWPDVHNAAGEGFSDGERSLVNWIQTRVINYFRS